MKIEKIDEISLKNDKKIEEILQKLSKLESLVYYLAMLMNVDIDELLEEDDEDEI